MDASFIRRWMETFADAIDAQREYLTQLDAVIGDADHGVNMQRGFAAVRVVLGEHADAHPGDLLVKVGARLISTVGGASGPLYGTAFRRLGKALPGGDTISLADLATALEAALAAVQELGAAEERDKTMVDAFAPAVRALRSAVEAGGDVSASLAAAADAAEAGMRATVPLRALKGRASYLGERSEGHQDPGATSTALLFRTLHAASLE